MSLFSSDLEIDMSNKKEKELMSEMANILNAFNDTYLSWFMPKDIRIKLMERMATELGIEQPKERPVPSRAILKRAIDDFQEIEGFARESGANVAERAARSYGEIIQCIEGIGDVQLNELREYISILGKAATCCSKFQYSTMYPSTREGSRKSNDCRKQYYIFLDAIEKLEMFKTTLEAQEGNGRIKTALGALENMLGALRKYTSLCDSCPYLEVGKME